MFSSANARRVSLTVKCFLMAGLTYANVLAGFANIELPVQLAEDIINAVVLIVQTFLMFVSAVAACYGLARKVLSTFGGTNKVIEQTP